MAVTQAELWVNLDLTLAAFADVARPFLQETITKGPGGQQTAIETFPVIRPFFDETAKFFANLQPGAAALEDSAPTLAHAFETGTDTLRASPAFNRRLESFLGDLRDFAQDPLVPIGLKDLMDLVDALDPTLKYLTPTQTVCNYASLFFRNAASLLSDGDKNGTWLRFMVVTTPVAPNGGPAPNGEGGPASAPANGGGRLIDGVDPNFLHFNPYPNSAVPGQDQRECEAGNDGANNYAKGRQAIGNVPGNQGTLTEDQPKQEGEVMEASGGTGRKIVMPRRFQGRVSTVRAGTLTVLVLVVAVYLAFTKSLPWQQPFEFNAVFQTGNNLRLDSPVRIAGVNVGEVTKVEREKDSDLVKVTMTLTDEGQPIHDGRDRDDPFADLPRGELLRRPAAGHAQRAADRRRRHARRHADRHAGAARPAADRAPNRRPRDTCRTC